MLLRVPKAHWRTGSSPRTNSQVPSKLTEKNKTVSHKHNRLGTSNNYLQEKVEPACVENNLSGIKIFIGKSQGHLLSVCSQPPEASRVTFRALFPAGPGVSPTSPHPSCPGAHGGQGQVLQPTSLIHPTESRPSVFPLQVAITSLSRLGNGKKQEVYLVTLNKVKKGKTKAKHVKQKASTT